MDKLIIYIYRSKKYQIRLEQQRERQHRSYSDENRTDAVGEQINLVRLNEAKAMDGFDLDRVTDSSSIIITTDQLKSFELLHEHTNVATGVFCNRLF